MTSPGTISVPGWDAASGAAAAAWSWTVATLSAAWAMLVSTTMAIWNASVRLTLDLWNTTVDITLNLWHATVSLSIEAWNGLVSASVGAWDGLVQFGTTFEPATLVGPLAASIVLLLAVTLLVGGVAGSVTPMIPGGLISLAGVYTYWLFGDPQRLGLLVLVLLTLCGLLVLVVDYFSGALAAKASGASAVATLAAAVVGLVLFLVTGPLGVIAGTVVTVGGVEYYRGQTAKESARSGVITAGGMIASSVVQLGLTVGMLVLFLIALVV